MDDAAEVQRLLCLLPGVEPAWLQKTSAFVRLGLAVRVPQSLALLAHVAAAANVPLHVEIDWACPGDHADLECVRYDLRVPVESGPGQPTSNLQFLGGMLAKQLKERGLLNASEADRLLRAWSFSVE